MQLKVEALSGRLEQGLARVYVLSGEEPLQLQEAADAIRGAARRHGYDERQVLDVDTGFDWSLLSTEVEALSLFSRRRLLELRWPVPKPGRDGANTLVRVAAHLPEDLVLLVITGKLEASTLKSQWCRSLEAAGTLIRIWPIVADELSGWVERRLRAGGLVPQRDAAALLAERVEGNLLAAAQEIDTLVLVHGPGAITASEVAAAVADSARFDVFELIECALRADAARTLRVLGGLRREGATPIQVLGVLVFELRRLSQLAWAVRQGQRPETLFTRYRIWGRDRQAAYQRGLRRQPESLWPTLLAQCAAVDRLIKGEGVGDPWQALARICLGIARAQPASGRGAIGGAR